MKKPFINFHAQLLEFQQTNKEFVLAIWICAGIACTCLALLGWTGHSFLMGMVLPWSVGLLAFWVSARQYKVFTERTASAGTSTWTVRVNGVLVGEITDSKYASICRAVEFDLRLYVQQMFCWLIQICRLVVNSVLAVPVLLFWGAVLWWFNAPSDFGSFMDYLKMLSHEDLNAAAPNLAMVAVVVFLVSGVIKLIMQGVEFFPCFDEAIACAVTQEIGCAAQGRVVLSQFEFGIQNGAKGHHIIMCSTANGMKRIWQ